VKCSPRSPEASLTGRLRPRGAELGGKIAEPGVERDDVVRLHSILVRVIHWKDACTTTRGVLCERPGRRRSPRRPSCARA
jgi:hypothetical protein